ncbi:hypothetical protein NDU88_006360 [Pleurodeles waltl]|uniref:Uncharacterized protein n=1 Tax=Pleurodeles waltl TaxID=8319 RepID=A0AAV7ULP8_PLEWA|nr:hypothetical protein NDU88_006360 [Pleurodeles waltl]
MEGERGLASQSSARLASTSGQPHSPEIQSAYRVCSSNAIMSEHTIVNADPREENFATEKACQEHEVGLANVKSFTMAKLRSLCKQKELKLNKQPKKWEYHSALKA